MIGIIGGYGDIGHHVVEVLLSMKNETLLIGARNQKDSLCALTDHRFS